MRRLAILSMLAACIAVPATAQYIIDDGTGETAVGVGNGPNSMLWGNNFVVTAGLEVITGVEVAFGFAGQPPPPGSPVRIFVARANPDGTLMQGGLLADTVGVMSSPGTNTIDFFDTPDVALAVGDNFMIGAIYDHQTATPSGFAARMDTTAPLPGRSYVAFVGGAGVLIDPNDIDAVPAAQRGYIESFNINGNWMVRATAQPIPEPATMIALGFGLAALAARRRRK